jgi:MFS family permease
VVGVALGALFGGKLINAFGRKKVIMIANAFIILFSLLSVFPNYPIILTVRFLFGVTVGSLLAAAPKIVLETVPAHLLGYGFGSFANIFTFFFISIIVALNMINKDEGKNSFMNTHGYIVLYYSPIPFTIIANLGLWFFWAGETPTHIIESYNCFYCEKL